MIEQIATQVMGYKVWQNEEGGFWIEPKFNPLKDWNDWAKVQARLIELGLWGEYIAGLITLVRSDEKTVLSPKQAGRTFSLVSDVMQSTLEQRCRAALKAVSE